MARPLHINIPDGWYHVMSRGHPGHSVAPASPRRRRPSPGLGLHRTVASGNVLCVILRIAAPDYAVHLHIYISSGQVPRYEISVIHIDVGLDGLAWGGNYGASHSFGHVR